MNEIDIDKALGAAVKRNTMNPAASHGFVSSDPRVMRELRSTISNTISEYQATLILYDGDVVGFREDMRSFINSLERLYKQWVLFETL